MLTYYAQMLDSPADRTKFEQLYTKYKKLMYGVAFKLLKNGADAEDAVHSAFESIIKNIEKVSTVNCPETKAFVVIIVERKALDIIRQRKSHEAAELDDEQFGVEIPLPGDSGLADALAQLPARYREVILLKFDNGFTTKEIAKMLDISTDSALKLLWRAKKALREKLNEGGISV